MTATRPLAVDVEGAAQLTTLSPGMIRKLTLLRQIPFAKVGSRTIYPVKDLADWIAERTERPA